VCVECILNTRLVSWSKDKESNDSRLTKIDSLYKNDRHQKDNNSKDIYICIYNVICYCQIRIRSILILQSYGQWFKLYQHRRREGACFSIILGILTAYYLYLRIIYSFTMGNVPYLCEILVLGLLVKRTPGHQKHRAEWRRIFSTSSCLKVLIHPTFIIVFQFNFSFGYLVFLPTLSMSSLQSGFQ